MNFFPLQHSSRTQQLIALTPAEVNAEFLETAQAATTWGQTVLLGSAALFFLAGFLSFLIWRGGD